MGTHGFGHEDWNLNTGDAIDGYVYGYIYRKYESLGMGTSPGPHDFYFWSRVNPRSPRLLVGVYRDAEFVPSKERTRIIQKMRKKGTFARRAAELKKLGLPRAGASRTGSAAQFLRRTFEPNLRARVENVKAVRPYKSLAEVLRGVRLPKLVRYHQFAEINPRQRLPGIGRFSRGGIPAGAPSAARVDSYWRITTAENKRILKREERLRRRLSEYLHSSHHLLFSTEEGHTDLIAEGNGQTCLMELKSCVDASTKIATRAALGQLLYYAYHADSGSRFANGVPPQSLFVVLDRKPDKPSIDWVKRLGRQLGIKTDLMWQKGSGFTSAFGLIDDLG